MRGASFDAMRGGSTGMRRKELDLRPASHGLRRQARRPSGKDPKKLRHLGFPKRRRLHTVVLRRLRYPSPPVFPKGEAVVQRYRNSRKIAALSVLPQTMPHPNIIQGGMGVAVSNWRLAHAVSINGQLGVVSAALLPVVLARRLQQGDLDVCRALAAFPDQERAKRVIDTYFRKSDAPEPTRAALAAMPTVKPGQTLGLSWSKPAR